jgi:hypothetical protein
VGAADPAAERPTFAHVFTALDAGAFNAAVYGYLASLPASPTDALPAVTRREREQRRAARARPAPPGLLGQAAADIAHARRYHGRDDQRILALYGYT